MKKQNNTFWEEKIKPMFRPEILEFEVKTPYFTGRYVNLDNAATTSPFAIVEKRVKDFLTLYGSVHRGSGQKSKRSTDLYECARDNIRWFVGAAGENYAVFTKNTTEAINHAAALMVDIPGKVLVSDIEHSSNLLPWLKNGEVIQYKTSTNGTLNVKDVEKVFKQNKDIKLLTITGSSNLTGYRPPIFELARVAHKYGAKILVDVCQLVPHSRVSMGDNESPEHIDFLAFSGHKMYAPFGGGVLVGPKSFFDKATPYQIGGGNLPYISRDLKLSRFETVQAHDPGTPNAVGAIAMSAAIDALEYIGFERAIEYEHDLVRDAYTKLGNLENVVLHVERERLGTVIPFEVKGFDSYLVAEILAQEYGIGVRAGSFCTYELLRKIKGISDEEDRKIAEEVGKGITKNIPSLVRASFGLVNNVEDVDRLVNALTEISKKTAEIYADKYCMDEKTGKYTLWSRK